MARADFHCGIPGALSQTCSLSALCCELYTVDIEQDAGPLNNPVWVVSPLAGRGSF